MRSKKRTETNVFSLSFLDIIACGFGAIVLLLLIVKVGEKGTDEDLTNDDLLKKLFSLQDRQIPLDSKVNSLNQRMEDLSLELNKEESLKLTKQEDLNSIRNEQIVIGKIKSRLTHAQQTLTDEMKALLDQSERDVEVGGIPVDSEYTFITFNENVVSLTDSKWLNSSDAKVTNIVLNALDQLAPTGGTNLEKALVFVKSIKPMPDALYLITDGLPTLGEEVEKFSSGFLEKCFRTKQRQKKTISSNCRHQLFQKAKKGFLEGRKIKTSTILLPLEGDPRAALDYWNLSIQSGGLLISPSLDWP